MEGEQQPQHAGQYSLSNPVFCPEKVDHRRDLPVELETREHLKALKAASVGVTAWLTSRIAPSELKRSNRIFYFTRPEAKAAISKQLPDGESFKSILVLPGLGTAQSRQENIDIIKQRGVDHVITLVTVVRLLAACRVGA